MTRIVMQFTAGELACAEVRKLHLTHRTRMGVDWLSVLLIVLIVAALYWFDAHPMATVPDARGLVDVLFVPLVVTLAVGVGSLPRLLATRPLIYGGQISFALYMVHELVHTGWNWVAIEYDLDLTAGQWRRVVLGILAVCRAGASRLDPGGGVPRAGGRRSRPRSCAARPLSHGRQISFALYMVHELVHTGWNWVAIEYDLDLTAGQWKLVVLGILAVCLAGASLLYHGVEEPTRRWMRRMVDVRDTDTPVAPPVAAAGAAPPAQMAAAAR